MEKAVTYQVSIEYSTVPVRYDTRIEDNSIHWEDYADANKTVREGHSEELEFISPAPAETVSEDRVVDEPAVLEQIEAQVREHLDRVCQGGYDLDGFVAKLAKED
jgi:hypothetical protein